MLSSPKKRTCPSLNCMIRVKLRRQPEGEMNGISPSITSTRAQAVQNVSLSNAWTWRYFFAGLSLPALLPRKVLKNSDDGSMTITSLFLLKLAL